MTRKSNTVQITLLIDEKGEAALKTAQGDLILLGRNIEGAGKAANGMSKSMDRASRSSKDLETGVSGLSRQFSVAKGHIVAVTAALAAMAAPMVLGVKYYAELQTQMAMVSTMLDATQIGQEKYLAIMNDYEAGIRRLRVHYGQSTETLTKGLYDLLSASVPTGDALDALNVSAQAGRAGFTDTAVAVDLLTSVINAYQMSADQAMRVSDITFAAVARGKTTFGELASVIGQVAPTANMVHVSFEQLAAMMANVTRQGIKTSEAASAVNQMLLAFVRKTSQDAIEAWEQLRRGTELENLEWSAALLQGSRLNQLLTVLAGATDSQKVALFQEVNALKAVNALTADLTGFTDDLSRTQRSAGETQRAYEKASSDLATQGSRLVEVHKDFLDVLGGAISPALQDASRDAADYYERLQELGVVTDIAARMGRVLAREVYAVSEAVKFLNDHWDISRIALQTIPGMGAIISAADAVKMITSRYESTKPLNSVKVTLTEAERSSIQNFSATGGYAAGNSGRMAAEKDLSDAIKRLRDKEASAATRAAEQRLKIQQDLSAEIIKLTQNEFAQRRAAIDQEIEKVRTSDAYQRASASERAAIEKQLAEYKTAALRKAREEEINFRWDLRGWDADYTDFWARQYQERYEVQARTIEAMTEAEGHFWREAAVSALEDYAESARDTADQVARLVTNSFRSMEDVLVEFVATGKLEFSSLVDSILADLARIAVQQNITGPLAGWLNGLSWFSPSPYPGTIAPNGAHIGVGGTTAYGMHGGGVVGRDYSFTRQVPSWWFDHAPRLHHGLAADEYPAILQRGETVNPKGAPQSVKVEIVNRSGQDVKSERADVQFNAQEMIVTVWLDAYGRNAYNLRSALGG